MSLVDSTSDSHRRLEPTIAPMANRVSDNGANNDNASLDLRHSLSLNQSASHAHRKHQHPAGTTGSYPSMPKENYHNFSVQQPLPYQQPQHCAGSNNKRHWQDTNYASSVKNPEAQRKRASTRQFAIKPVTAFELLHKARSQETTNNSLYLIPPGSLESDCHKSSPRNDDWLKLGLGITELAGEAGSGKSQMAMNLCVQAVMRNLQTSQTTINQGQGEPNNAIHLRTRFTSRAVYISLAGGQASLSRIAYRMQQMADAQQPSKFNMPPQNQPSPQDSSRDNTDFSLIHSSHNNHNNITIEDGTSSSSSTSHPSVLSQILTHSVRNQDDLFTLLREDLPICLHQGHHQPADTVPNPLDQETSSLCDTKEPPVALVVLDSIADLFRLGNSDGAEDKAAILKRSYLLFELAALLRELSDRYKVPILVVNQVSCDFASNSNLPALGLSWANCINASYVIRRPKNQTISNGNGNAGNSAASSSTHPNNGLRHIFLAKSSKDAVDQMASFVIDSNGVKGVP